MQNWIRYRVCIVHRAPSCGHTLTLQHTLVLQTGIKPTWGNVRGKGQTWMIPVLFAKFKSEGDNFQSPIEATQLWNSNIQVSPIRWPKSSFWLHQRPSAGQEYFSLQSFLFQGKNEKHILMHFFNTSSFCLGRLLRSHGVPPLPLEQPDWSHH